MALIDFILRNLHGRNFFIQLWGQPLGTASLKLPALHAPHQQYNHAQGKNCQRTRIHVFNGVVASLVA
jgi:hypothetical protein